MVTENKTVWNKNIDINWKKNLKKALLHIILDDGQIFLQYNTSMSNKRVEAAA